MKFSRGVLFAVVAVIVLISVAASASTTYLLFLPKSTATIHSQAPQMTVQETVTEIAPITLTETKEQTILQTIVQTSSIYVSSQKADALNYSSGLQLELALNTSVIFEQPREENE